MEQDHSEEMRFLEKHLDKLLRLSILMFSQYLDGTIFELLCQTLLICSSVVFELVLGMATESQSILVELEEACWEEETSVERVLEGVVEEDR